MLKKSNFKAKKKGFYYFISLSFVAFLFFILSLDLGKIFDSEKQQLQSFASTFSTPTQLFDEGNKPSFGHMSTKDILPITSNLSKSIYDGIIGNENRNLKEIKIFIKFKNFEKILKDREKALVDNINVGSHNVACKVSDGVNVYKCKVKLKGNRSDHWTSIKRMSLRIDVKDGLIHGMKEFAIQKPGSRQFPYDPVFHNFNNGLERLSAIRQDFYKITLNGESWGVMNAEPVIDEKFLELQEVKRLGIFRISDEKKSAYFRRWNDGRYLDYFISDPSVTINIRGKEEEILQDPILNELYSHIHLSLSSQNGRIFDRDAFIGNLALALAWGDTHSLYPRNMWLTWNPYEQHLEPILTDQGFWRDAKTYTTSISDLPYVYKILFRQNPLSTKELQDELRYLDDFFKENNPIQAVNNLKKDYFPNDQRFTITPIFSNLSFLKENVDEIVQKINLISKKVNKDEPINKITSEQLKKIDKVSEIFHFSDGTIRIFNLLGDEVKVESIGSKDREIIVNKTIAPSRLQDLSFIDIKTDFIGSYSNAIYVKFNINEVVKNNVNTYSLQNLDYKLSSSTNSEKYCDYYEIDDLCVLNGIFNFNETIVFESKTIIEPGTKIILNQGGNLIFKSSLLINGTKESPVNVEGNSSGGIFIKNNKEQVSVIKNTTFNNLATLNSLLSRYTGSVNGYGGIFILEDVNISNGKAEDQLNLINAKINITGLNIDNAISDAFDCDFCEGTIEYLNLKDVGGDGLDISGSKLKVSQMKAKYIKDKAFSVGEKSYAVIDNAEYDTIATGIAVKDSSIVKASNISLKNVGYDSFMTYVKKPFYMGETRLEVTKYTTNNTNNDSANICVREIGTNLIINNENCDVSEIDVDTLYQGRMKK